MVDDVAEFGHFLRGLRQRRKLTLREVAKLAEVDHAYIQRLETGSKAAPSADVLAKLAKALGATKAEADTLRYLARNPDARLADALEARTPESGGAVPEEAGRWAALAYNSGWSHAKAGSRIIATDDGLIDGAEFAKQSATAAIAALAQPGARSGGEWRLPEGWVAYPDNLGATAQRRAAAKRLGSALRIGYGLTGIGVPWDLADDVVEAWRSAAPPLPAPPTGEPG